MLDSVLKCDNSFRLHDASFSWSVGTFGRLLAFEFSYTFVH
jgi:hypothetical protein